MKLEIHRTPEVVAVAAADLASAALQSDPEMALLMPAGRTPVAVYAELVRRAAAGDRALRSAHVFQLDEMVGVGPTDPRSFAAFLRTHLLDRLERVGGRDHLLDGAATDPEAAIAAHSTALADRGGAGLALLGLGQNGHIAFNEPGTDPGLGARVVALRQSSRAALGASFPEGAPERGMTLGLLEIVAARHIVIVVTGLGKRSILAALASGSPTTELPASLLQDHPSLTILADEAAAGALAGR